jgi:hypothetical protein
MRNQLRTMEHNKLCVRSGHVVERTLEQAWPTMTMALLVPLSVYTLCCQHFAAPTPLLATKKRLHDRL